MRSERSTTKNQIVRVVRKPGVVPVPGVVPGVVRAVIVKTVPQLEAGREFEAMPTAVGALLYHCSTRRSKTMKLLVW
jgi:hypothetical protein